MASNEVKRRSYQGHLATAMNKLQAQLKEKTLDENKIEALIEKVTAKYQRVEDITNILQANMEEATLEADIAKMDELENQVIEIKTEAKSILSKLRQPPPILPKPDSPSKFQTTPPKPPTVSVKLPDVTLPEFHGDEETFPSFLDQFTALIDKNPNLSEVEKFGYLKGAVKVDVIKYYPLTASNYKVALNKLKEEYGDESLIANKLRNSLLDMSKRKPPSNNQELQEFYSFLEAKLTCLEALNQPVEECNEMLITLIYRQLPKKLKNQIAQLDNTHSTVSSVMGIIKTHIKTIKKMEQREESDGDSEYEVFTYEKSSHKFSYQ